MRYQQHHRKNSGNISEFGPAVFLLIMIFVVPMINLIWLSAAYAVIALAANYYASTASVETTYDRSLASMYSSALAFNKSAWGSFGGLTPYGGYGSTGADLYVKSTDISSHNVNRVGPNIAPAPPIDTSSKVWEYEAKVHYDVKPLLNMASVPFIGDIPGLGAPARLSFSAHKLVEHPDGLARTTTNTTFARQPNGSIMTALPAGGGGGGVLPTDTSWFHPDIYQQIAAAGQTVVKQEVLTVYANNPNWTDTGIAPGPGQNVWIDLRADGKWNVFNGDPMFDADGDATLKSNNGPEKLDKNFTKGMLIGHMESQPDNFAVGKFQLNLAPPGTGKLSLIINDDINPGPYSNNEGSQVVRIILTQ